MLISPVHFVSGIEEHSDLACSRLAVPSRARAAAARAAPSRPANLAMAPRPPLIMPLRALHAVHRIELTAVHRKDCTPSSQLHLANSAKLQAGRLARRSANGTLEISACLMHASRSLTMHAPR